MLWMLLPEKYDASKGSSILQPGSNQPEVKRQLVEARGIEG